jgi:hypothetical protein
MDIHIEGAVWPVWPVRTQSRLMGIVFPKVSWCVHSLGPPKHPPLCCVCRNLYLQEGTARLLYGHQHAVLTCMHVLGPLACLTSGLSLSKPVPAGEHRTADSYTSTCCADVHACAEPPCVSLSCAVFVNTCACRIAQRGFPVAPRCGWTCPKRSSITAATAALQCCRLPSTCPLGAV